MEKFYPLSIKVSPGLPTKGRYENGHPRGAVVHFTAGAYGLSELDLARQLGYTYFLIDEHGGVHQGFPLDRWGSHAGQSHWPSLGPNAVSNRLVGIEVDCAGKLVPDGKGDWITWWKKPVAKEEVRTVEREGNMQAGAYHKYTSDQERALFELILWLKSNAPDVFDLDLVLGHDEVSPGRKNDPGGSLSMTMPQYRQALQLEWKYRQARLVASPALVS